MHRSSYEVVKRFRGFGGEGLRKAIDEFLLGNAGWRIIEERRNNNGLIVLERVPW